MSVTMLKWCVASRRDTTSPKRSMPSNKLQQTTMIKHTKMDLQSFLDQAEHTVIGLEATGQFSAEAMTTSMLLQRLPKVDKEAWLLQTHEETHIRPPKDLFRFLRARIDMVDAGLTDPESLSKGGEAKPDPKPEFKKEKRRDKSTEPAFMPTLSSHTNGIASCVLQKSTPCTNATSSNPWMSRPVETR